MTFDKRQVEVNGKDPLKKPRSDNGQRVFQAMSQVANGFSHEDVVTAAANLIVNAVRQANPTARQAEMAFDELAAKMKGVLLGEHYFPNGSRRNVFPFHQVIRPAFFEDKDLIKSLKK